MDVIKNLIVKKIIRKSKSDFDKDLDLLLIDDIKHYILIKNINKFINDNSHAIKTCRSCLNVFYSELEYKLHIEYFKFKKPKKLMSPFKKYMKFENLKNCILNNWIIHLDFECIIDPITKEHSFIAGGYYLECRNNKFSKKVQTFYDLKEYTISLVKELVYIDNIESTHCDHFQQFYDRCKIKVHVPIIRWSHCEVIIYKMKFIILILIKKNLTMLKFVNIVNLNSITHIIIDILFYMKYAIKKN